MTVGDNEREWAHRARRFLRAEIKRAEISYAELARRLKEHGLEETEASIANKLSRGTFALSHCTVRLIFTSPILPESLIPLRPGAQNVVAARAGR
jgi:hypothetical protein